MNPRCYALYPTPLGPPPPAVARPRFQPPGWAAPHPTPSNAHWGVEPIPRLRFSSNRRPAADPAQSTRRTHCAVAARPQWQCALQLPISWPCATRAPVPILSPLGAASAPPVSRQLLSVHECSGGGSTPIRATLSPRDGRNQRQADPTAAPLRSRTPPISQHGPAGRCVMAFSAITRCLGTRSDAHTRAHTLPDTHGTHRH